jgi:hypothetical protein
MTSTATTDRAIAALVEIMCDVDQAPRARIAACEHALGYECPREVIEQAKAVLLSIVEDCETLVDVKLDALKLLRRVESRRVSPGRAISSSDIELSQAAEILQRRSALLKAGVFPRPDGYADDLYAEDYTPLPRD